MPFTMAIKNVEIMNGCCPQQMRLVTVNTTQIKETAYEDEQEELIRENSNDTTKKVVPED